MRERTGKNKTIHSFFYFCDADSLYLESCNHVTMVELDVILENMERLSARQWLQMILMMIPSVLVGSQMGAMVFLGADIGRRCKLPREEELVKV